MSSNRSIFNLINAANVTSGLLFENHVKSVDELAEFSYVSNGVPILIEADSEVFDFDTQDVFEIAPNELCRMIYTTTDTSYVGYRHAFPTNKFIRHFKVKKHHKKKFREIIDQNDRCREYIKNLHLKFNKIGAFQSRNIPHAGHEKILKKMLELCDHVVINPVTGPKKPGDVRVSVLESVFKFLAENKYADKISFVPIVANMFYAGPREAVHHTRLRNALGFDLFSVGRDHAGAENLYPHTLAAETVKSHCASLNIKVFCHNGAAYCAKCDQIILRGECECDTSFLLDIRGTDFRQSLEKKQIFEKADIRMQELLFRDDQELFE